MLKSHERFHSVNGKRQILIADDEMINRAILGEMLKEDYEVIYAVDGAETLDKMRACRDTLSLVLLDILMPVKSGMDVLREVRNDDRLSRIPIIVMTAEKKAEIESLELGAIDFIPKPYPELGVIQARVRRTIELSEDREIIQSTERDPLTGLYNKDYFYRYARQFDQYHKDTVMDAVIVDVNHFHMINERYGKAYGDEVLRKLAGSLRRIVQESGGIAGRRNADMFMIYSPRREDHEALMEEAASWFQDEESTENRVRLRMGVYSGVDKSVEMEQRFDRAKMAADTIRGSFAKTVAYYDKNLHERQLYAEQLIEDFPAAVAEKQFQVFYQPKFDVRPDTPVLAGAEALVRWFHPDLGMISPGVFIPLFEENGLIQRLDNFVWEETARQIREWKDCLQYSVPVSVNVSRIDLFDPRLADKLQAILRKYDLTGRDFHLEVTESAYTQDAARIIEAVENLRALGFLIEMDDFGTGYSSLHMISSLPIDVLKVDMQFIREAFSVGGNTHMLDVIIGIADYLSVPVIAEGVETQDQLHALKQLGCDMVQG
ncbi:MAG: EAL domain-containing protein, partial [Lachnospiraceae bacterium]|nr:EAL domain-containing protein [Lachnospiraceae bacterium]